MRATTIRQICCALWPGLLSFGLLIGCTPSANGTGAKDPGSPGDGIEENGTKSPPQSSGEKAPDFELPTLDGDTISLSDYRGKKVVLLDFWSTTCDPCLREMPELVKIYQERKDKGFVILAISIDGPETIAKVRTTAKSSNMIFPILLDEETEVMDRYNPKGELPFTLVVDRAGTITLKRAGYNPGDEASMQKLVKAIDAAIAQ